MATRFVLGDLTEFFEPEVKELGDPAKCYCDGCTELNQITWSWLQFFKPAPAYEPAFKHFAYLYGVHVKKFEVLAAFFGEDPAALIIRYSGAPTAQVTMLQFCSGERIHNDAEFNWVTPQILTYWHDPMFFGTSQWRWVYLDRKVLFSIFFRSEEQAIMQDMKYKFDLLKRSVAKCVGPVGQRGFKNKVYFLSMNFVEVPDSSDMNGDSLVINFGASDHPFGSWPLYFVFFEEVFHPENF